MAVIVAQLAAVMPDRGAIYFRVCDTVCAAMLLGLVLACLWVIFRRSAFPWRTVWRMFMVFLVVLFFASMLIPIFPRFYEPAQLFAGLSSLTGAILTGFHQARAFPRTQPRLPDSGGFTRTD
jgi:glucose-6-phosphate-specific signal transduction histidine kinase